MLQFRLGFLTLLISVLFTVQPAALAQPQAPGTEPSVDDIDLKTEIDRSIRWLRSTQGPNGSYAGTVGGTAWALQAFAMSPRKYTRRDGPFISKALDYLSSMQNAEDGGIYSPEAGEFERTNHSILAWLALRQYQDEKSSALRVSLEKYFAELFQPSPAKALTTKEARAMLSDWFGRRKPDASWEGPDGSVIRTSEGIIALTRCRDILTKNEEKTFTSKLPAFTDADRDATLDSMRRGALFLIAVSENGLWGAPGQPEMGTTAMALGALQELPVPRPAEVQEVIDTGLAWLAKHQDKDGSIHDGKLKNYLTSASVLALAKSKNPKYKEVIGRARQFLVTLQADEGEGYTDGDLYYGGIGYGNDERPDLSNLQMALEALSASGLEEGDESFTRALKFLDRVQNRSESNDISIKSGDVTIKSGDDGGAGYAPGDSKAGFDVREDGTKVPRSYGSMTYALLKGFIFAGLPKDDPRMEAAWNWIQANYTLDVNPGFEHSEDPRAPYQGIYYYFHTMAKALDLYGSEQVVDKAGKTHAWRQQICGRLIAMQRKDDGSWINQNAPRWWEGNPVLASSYAMLTLGSAIPNN
ncbi:MAG: squalene-hopene/tetraprenyl-beta-curcumene cyclase [Planctomycetota bacterium]|jgi:squalene-hopene/tetraprenyl-beta-curcumene cyclase